MHFAVPLLFITAIINVLLGLFVFGRNPKLLSSRAFLVITLSVAIWCLGLIGFYSFNDPVEIEASIKTYYIAALLMNASLLVFTGAFVKSKNKRLYYYFPLISWAVASVLILLVDGILFTTGEKLEFGIEVVLNTGPYLAYSALVIGYYIITLWTFYKHLGKGSVQQRHQIRYILAGLVIAGVFASFFNVFLPGVGNYAYVWSGPLFTATFVAAISYAIIKHRLFDVRAAVARAIAYIAAVTSVMFIYVAVISILSNTNLLSANLTTLQRVAYATIAVLSGLLFPPFKRYFDKITNKYFYRDSYDAQALIGDLNKTLVNSTDLEGLLTKSALIIQETLKAQYCTFYIRETSYFPSRIIGAHRKDPEIENIEKIEKLSTKIGKKVHSAEDTVRGDEAKELNELLQENEFEIMARLVTTLEYEVQGIGLIFIGPKRSGSLYTKEDLRVLEIVANELVIACENVLRYEEIEQFNVTLQKKIDEATKELKQTNDKLRALDEAKDEFVSMASHQLRTPLTSIKGYISMVLEGDAGKVNETQNKMLGQAMFSSQRMVYLIADLLNVSRLKTGKFSIDQKPTYLPDVVQSEIEQLFEGASAKNLTLSFKKPKEFVTLNLDEMKIRQVVMNFTDNAIYYTPTHGKITIELNDTGKSVEFTVKDTGIGVPKAQQPKLFTKFYRADNARKARPDGTGLGLFMAKKVIIAQGGSIIFKSTEGKGSTFGFSFPKDRLIVEQKATEKTPKKK